MVTVRFFKMGFVDMVAGDKRVRAGDHGWQRGGGGGDAWGENFVEREFDRFIT